MSDAGNLGLATIAPSAHSPASVGKPSGAHADEAHEAGRKFEAVMVRTMLKPIEKSLGMGSLDGKGGNMYSSIAVDAMADAIANAGGLGLGEVLAASLQEAEQPTSEKKK